MRPLLRLDSLSDWLWDSGYMPSEALDILQSAQRHYSLEPAAQCGMLDREDYPIAAAILQEANACLGPPTDAELAAYWPDGGDA
jgi:hypothetical protein